MFTDDWKLAIVVDLARLNIVGGPIREVAPPPGVKTLHVLVGGLPAWFDDYIGAITSGVDDFEAAQLNQAIGILDALTTTFREIGILTDSLCG